MAASLSQLDLVSEVGLGKLFLPSLIAVAFSLILSSTYATSIFTNS